MSPTMAVRPMHPPSFETIPEMSPVLEYRSDQKQAFPQPPPQPQLQQQQQHADQYSHLRRPIPVRSATAPSSPTASRQQQQQPKLPPLKTTFPSAYPMYPGLQTPPSDRQKTSDALPMVLNRPRKIGSSARARDSATSASSVSSAGSSSTVSSYTLSASTVSSYDSPTTTYSFRQHQKQYQQQQQMQLQRPSTANSLIPRPQHKRAPAPNELFGALPGEVLELILDSLKELHLSEDSTSCATCWMRDLCSLSLSSRKWAKVARYALYQDIQLNGADSAAQKKKFKLTQGTRITLLRRTLRSNKHLASTVRSLKVPLPDAANSDTSPTKNGGASPMEQYENKVASLIMACPNLEVLAGPLSSYNHSFSRIFHALSTRRKLKTMNWRIEPSPAQQEPLRPESACGISSAGMPADLDASQEMVFLGHHRSWSRLTSLSIHCLPGASLAPDTLLQRTLTCLPSLKHLHLSCLPANAFNDNNLLSLPPLESLTLSHISGISSSGLSTFATRSASRHLRNLHLRHTPLTSLPALARLLSNLGKLRFFSLVQDFSPLMPSDDDVFTLWMMPYLASSTITKIHWDITAHLPAGGVNDADDILARSIEAGGFPSLTTLRTPNDPEGIFQALCRPVENIALSSDRIWASHGRSGSSHSATRPGTIGHRSTSSSASSSTTTTTNTATTAPLPQPPSPAKIQKGNLNKSSTAVSLPTALSAPPPHGTDLRTARVAAQARLDDARLRPRFTVNVTSEEGELVDKFALAGYVGTIGSTIDYHLWPDAGSCDEQSGLVDVPDLADGENSGAECCGSWNWREGVVADKKEKEKWWHTERGRWIRPRLE